MNPEQEQAYERFTRAVRNFHTASINWWATAASDDKIRSRFEAILTRNDMGPQATQDGGAR